MIDIELPKMENNIVTVEAGHIRIYKVDPLRAMPKNLVCIITANGDVLATNRDKVQSMGTVKG